jgi:hypothetical protein
MSASSLNARAAPPFSDPKTSFLSLPRPEAYAVVFENENEWGERPGYGVVFKQENEKGWGTRKKGDEVS